MRFANFKGKEPPLTESTSIDSRPGLRRSGRRWPKVLSASLAAVLVVGAGGAALAYFVGRPWAAKLQANLERDLRTGADELQLGSDGVRKANQTHDVAQLEQAKTHFSTSREAFASASARVRSEWLLTQAQRVPVVGQRYLAPRLAVVTHVAAMGIALDDAGQDTADVDRPLLAPASPGQSGGQRLTAVLGDSGPGLARIHSDLSRADRAAALVDPDLLPRSQRPSFLKAKEQIQKGLAGIAEFQRLSPVLLEILGANGSRTYLIEQVNPAELRGGGGFIGSFSVLSADHGVLKLGKTGDVGPIDRPYPLPGNPKYVAPPNSSKQFTQHGWVFGDSNFSADFPTSARAGETLFQNETGIKVDGVISMDPTAVAALLQVSGPIPVPEYNTTAEAGTFAEEVFQRQEKLANIVPGKKNFFPAVADRLIERISNLPSDGWPNLLTVLNTAVVGRHLQVYFNNEVAQTEMVRVNWAGAMLSPTPRREVMLEVESNFSGNKSNHFLERSYDLTLVHQNGKLRHHLVINLKNATPDGYEGGRQYTCYLRFYYPATATDAVTLHLTPDVYPSDEKPNGLKLADGWLHIEITDLKVGFATHQVVLDYTTDVGDMAGGHEIYWQKQAGVLSDKVHVSLQTGGKTFTADSDLAQDRLFILTNQGLRVAAANVAGAQLSILGT